MTADTHDRFADSAAAYLLGALPELEATAYERHVMGCAECRDELERLRPAVEALPRSVTPLRTPPSLGRSLMAVVEAEAAEAAAAASGSRRRESRAAAAVRIMRTGFARARPATAWASAAFLLAVGIVAGFAAHDLGAPGDRTVSAMVKPDELAEGSGTLVVHEDEDRATLSVHGVPELPAEDDNSVYQLWLVRGDEVIPSSLLSVSADGSGFTTIPNGIEGADEVWVTRERPGGTRAPTEPVVMRVEL